MVWWEQSIGTATILFAWQLPRVALGEALGPRLSPSGAAPAMSFTEAPPWSSMTMRQFSPLHHFHLPARCCTLAASYEHCLFNLIPSLGIWGAAMAHCGRVPLCPFSGARYLCRGGRLQSGIRAGSHGGDEKMSVASYVSTSFPIWEGGEGGPRGRLENKRR